MVEHVGKRRFEAQTPVVSDGDQFGQASTDCVVILDATASGASVRCHRTRDCGWFGSFVGNVLNGHVFKEHVGHDVSDKVAARQG